MKSNEHHGFFFKYHFVDCTAGYGGDYTLHRRHFLHLHNKEEYFNVTLTQCRDLCTSTDSFICRTFEYGYLSQKCGLQEVTYLDVPNNWYEDIYYFEWDYYQRDCLWYNRHSQDKKKSNAILVFEESHEWGSIFFIYAYFFFILQSWIIIPLWWKKWTSYFLKFQSKFLMGWRWSFFLCVHILCFTIIRK